MTTYTIARHGPHWFILGADDGPMGPYSTRAEAEQDRRGLERFEKHGHERRFWTTDSPSARKGK